MSLLSEVEDRFSGELSIDFVSNKSKSKLMLCSTHFWLIEFSIEFNEMLTGGSFRKYFSPEQPFD